MTNAKLFLLPVALLVSVLCCAAAAHATVYSWRDEHGKLHFCNDQEEIPEAHRTVAKTFKSKFVAQTPVTMPVTASVPSAEVPVTAPVPHAEPVAISAYERGLEHGLQTAARQVALAGELARTLLAAAPQPPPSPPAPPQIIIVQQPAPIVRYVSPSTLAIPSDIFCHCASSPLVN